MNFGENYHKLNAAQKQAVDTIDGPVLVIAGPGTGKTQLLSLRVANILDKTDTLAQNILCLTFTENGAANMRERLTRFIGQDAYNVSIDTYHAFGGDLIKRFPEYFADARLENPADDLTKYQILESIIDELRFDNPLKQTQHHLRDLISTISEVKRALLTAADLRDLALENSQFIELASQRTALAMESFTIMPRKLDKALPFFEAIVRDLRPLVPETPVNPQFGSLAHIAVRELEITIEQAGNIDKTKPLTDWKNAWLAKDSGNRFVLDGALKNRRISALADVFEAYESALNERGLYDFDDMILRSIQALQTHDDLRFTLQEQYLYIMLDEFQDTNAAQLKLIELLTNNPAAEGRPNVLAVGDDDQAIYAFQGAQYSNMLDFYQMYQDVTVVNLTENYRSHADILHAASNVAQQIEARLHHHFEGASKQLVAANPNLPQNAHIDRHEFLSDVAEYAWIAQRIAELIQKGTKPSDIAVLAPKHKQLEPLVPYLNKLNVPVRYEKRENILETPVVHQLVTMSKLILALGRQDSATADSLWPEVLSYDFWQIPIAALWQFGWEISDSRGDTSWSKALLDNDQLRQPALLLIALSQRVNSETLETMLDQLIGSAAVDVHDQTLRSPLRAFYASDEQRTKNPESFYETLSHLTVLRAKLREFQDSSDATLGLKDLITFVEMYEAAGERLINASPYTQAADAVQLMTVFKAKGLEFDHVFLPHTLDDVWGESSRGNSNKISLPHNLAPIRHAGANQDERLRIFFVALTRAKLGLHITSFTTTYSGKTTKRLKYLSEQQQPDGSHKTLIFPENFQLVQFDDLTAPSLETLEQNWQTRHIQAMGNTRLQDLLRERLAKYQLSPTHLGDFIDLEHCGPEKFFFRTLLRFPQAPIADGEFGSAIHQTLEWLQHQYDKTRTLPGDATVIKQFVEILDSKRLSPSDTEQLAYRGEVALKHYLEARRHIFETPAKAEYNFRREGVFVGDVHMAGTIDRMEIDQDNKTITVVDYKTGKSFSRWESSLKLHKYKYQLYCYKLLIEGSHTFKGYSVTSGRLEFIEPDESGAVHTLELEFKDTEMTHIKQLLAVMWRKVHALDMPDISGYGSSLTEVKRFEQFLVDEGV